MTDATANEPARVEAGGLRSALLSFARSELPEAMVPARIVVLDRLPTLPNGKVDRRALPTGEARPESEESGFTAPRNAVEDAVARIWAEILGTDRIDVEASFFDLGGDSLTAVQMISRVRKEFDVELALRELFAQPTVAKLAGLLGGDQVATRSDDSRSIPAEELAAEAVLPEDVVPSPTAAPVTGPPYENVLLTGATGFTGAFLLREVLDRSPATVHLLVRAEGAEEAVERVRANLAGYGLWRDGDERRLAGVPGDLGRPYFGLSPAVYHQLAGVVDLVLHNGSWSSFVLPYQRLKPINVLGTTEILRFASLTRIKPVHYVSSLAVLPGHREIKHFEEVELADPDGVVGGYPQSKWVAERLVTLAGARGLPVSVYRPGQITGAERGGACPPELFVCAMMKSCIQLGVAPDPDMMVEMVPVDFVAAAIAHIALSGRDSGRCYHLPSSKPAHWRVLMGMLAECGYPIRVEPYQVWYEELTAAFARGEDNALGPFMPLLGPDGPSEDLAYQNGNPYFAHTNLDEGLRGSGIECPGVTVPLLRTYLDYFVSTGFLAPPGEQA